ncbi:F0F1 ATP synthase subunit epsilon, partial [Acidithiobacillus ferridurans]|nr:F0F1 ATP synthase subunit epsilon [Acidithiobacillus ferridurans]
MAMTIDVRVVSAEGSIYAGVADMVVAPGEMG